jgi:hypothetical protein
LSHAERGYFGYAEIEPLGERLFSVHLKIEPRGAWIFRLRRN